MSRWATLAARWLHEPQPISNHPVRLGFPHRAERYRPGGSALSSLICRNCRGMEWVLIRGWEIILSRCDGTSALVRGLTLAARWLHEPQPISNQLVGWGFHTARGGIESKDLRFRPRVVGIVCGEPFDLGIKHYLPRVRRDLHVGQRGNSRRALVPSQLHPITNQPMGLGFPRRAGRFRPGGNCFRPQIVGVVDIWKDK